MQKHPRQAFGIFEDGHGLSIAHIFRENNQLFIDAVERIEMEKPSIMKKSINPAKRHSSQTGMRTRTLS